MPNTVVEVALVVPTEAAEASVVSERKVNDDLLERVAIDVPMRVAIDVPLRVAIDDLLERVAKDVPMRVAIDDLLQRLANQGIIEGHSEVDTEVDTEAEKDVEANLEVALEAEKEVAIMVDALKVIMKKIHVLKEMIVIIAMKTKTAVTTKEEEAEADEFRCPALPKNAWIKETYSKASAQIINHDD
jgi:hypothetical protein